MQRSDLSRLTGWRMAFLAMAAGGLMGLAQAPFNLPPGLLLGIPLLVLMARERTVWGRFRVGWWAGVGYFGLTLHWIVEPFLVDIVRHGWMAPFAIVLKAGGHALFWGGGFAMMIRAAPLISLAVGWTLFEFLRANALTGFPWALVAYGWEDTAVVQLAAITGPHLLGALTVAVATLPAVAPKLWQGCAGALVLVALGWGIGAARMPEKAEETGTMVRIVQPNAEQHLKWQPDMMQVFFDRLRSLTRAEGEVDVVIWPEAAVPYLIDQNLALNAAIAQDKPDATVILGGRRIEADETDRWYNSLAALNPDGSIAALYDKHHLVPFGEFLPFPGFWDRFGLQAIAQNVGVFARGAGPSLITLDGVPPFQPLICYEMIFPHEIRRIPRPDWLVHVTNDAWFGQFSGPYQHLAQAKMRAIEQGVPVARSANTGVSAMIDPYGRITALLPLGTQGAFDAVLPAPLSKTIYAKTGDMPVLALLLLWIGVSLLQRRTASG